MVYVDILKQDEPELGGDREFSLTSRIGSIGPFASESEAWCWADGFNSEEGPLYATLRDPSEEEPESPHPPDTDPIGLLRGLQSACR